MNFYLLVYLFLQIAICTSIPDRAPVRRDSPLQRRPSQDNVAEFKAEAVGTRMVYVFPSDDEDSTAEGSGNDANNDEIRDSDLYLQRIWTISESSADFEWIRITINFMRSIEFADGFNDYESERFRTIGDELASAIEEELRSNLDGYVEVVHQDFERRGEDVHALFNVGVCARNGVPRIENALNSLVADGTIGTLPEYRVSRRLPSILVNMGRENNKEECLPAPTLLELAVSSTARALPSRRSTLPFFNPGFRRSTAAPSSPAVMLRSATPCRPDQATCQNLQCINRNYVCDGIRDCSDGSDEPETCGQPRKVCDPTEFLCVGTDICAQKIWRCDGEDDCGNGYDELNCPNNSPGSDCAANQFQCGNGICIPSSHQCDGEFDCDDRNDETGCTAPVVIAPPVRRFSAVEGDSVTMHCEAAGTPTPIVSWRVNWGNLPPPPRVMMTSVDGFGTLTIKDVRLTDQGAYTCEVINSIDAILATPDAVLTVEERPFSPTIASTGCELGFFNVAPPGTEAICKPCFCFGLTNQCHTSKYEFSEIGIDFEEPNDNNQGVKLDSNDTIEGSPETQQPITKNQIRVNPPARELQLIDLSKRFLAAAHYWSLPAQFLGAKINSYGGTLTFSYSYNTSVHIPSEPTDDVDIILEGNGRRLLYRNPNPHPQPRSKHRTEAILSEEDNWMTPEGTNATREDLMVVLEDLDKILLRTVYDNSMISTGIGEVKLQVARPVVVEEASSDVGVTPPPEDIMAYSIEECQCPEGYAGLSCETCDVGYERVLDGPLLGRCIFSDEQRAPPSRIICNEGYTGVNCQECAEGYTPYEGGCTRYPDTYCSVAGSIGLNADQTCECKEGCEGARCDRCKPGYFYLSASNPTGCIPCFCMNVTDECYSTTWNMTEVSPSFQFDQLFLLKNADSGLVFEDGITVELPPLGGTSQPYITAPLNRFPEGVYYWMLPEEFTGNKLGSYGADFNYTIVYSDERGASALTTLADVILSGNDVTLRFFADHQPEPNVDTKIHLTLNEENWWTGTGEVASREDILLVLSNIDIFLVRASYSDEMQISSIKDISLGTAVPANTGETRAFQVEECVCPPGYTGLSCEECDDGYYRMKSGKFLGNCVPCNCNQHSGMCDKETGVCLNCLHNTEGYQCERCVDGYYGDPRTGAVDACKPCPCPVVDGEGSIPLCSVDCEGRPICTRCPEGYKGKTCQLCDEGFERSPDNPNICTMAEGIIDCRCNPVGAQEPVCDGEGQCNCKASTTGEICDQCQRGYFFLSEENQDGGCLPCFCMGITNRCDSAALKRNQIVANFTDDYGGFRLTQQSCLTHVTEGYDVLNEGRTLSYPNLGELSADRSYFWQLPDEYRGDKIVSYGGKLEYKASYTTLGTSDVTSDPDVILVGNGVMLTSRMTGPDSAIRPNEVMNRYVIFRENYWEDVSGQPATREQLLMALADVDSILIRATYDQSTRRTTISDVAMDTASDNQLMTEPAYEVEQCRCPTGYRGTSCQNCAPGFRRVEGNLYLGYCQQCQCNGHSEQCDSDSGRCLNCLGNTAGDRCETCAIGYYKIRREDVTSECFACACPGTGENNFADSCYWDELSNSLQCSRCQQGYTGQRCERCIDGYVGNPTVPGGKCIAGSAPQVCVSPNEVKVRIGGTASLRCTVRSNSTSRITWRRGGSSPGPLPSRTSVLEDGQVLRFQFFTASQAGTYECIGTNMFGSNSDSSILSVSTGDLSMIRVQVEQPNNVTVKEGAQAMFACTASSQVPAYVISWTKENDRLPMSRTTDSDGVLNIRDVQITDSGAYVCTGSNMYNTDRATAHLKVIPAIRPEIPSAIVTPERQQVSEGEEVMFYCTAKGHPTPSIEWRRANGQPLPNEARVVGSMLMIPAARIDDGSVYSCRASNNFGEVEARGALDVTARGSPPVVTVLTPDVSVKAGDDVTLRCSAVGVPNPQFTWTKRNQGFPSNVIELGNTLRLTSVSYNNQGFYMCTASNQFGSDFGYVRLAVRRRPPMRPVCQTDPKAVTAYVGTNSTINCVVGGTPPPGVRWETEDGSPLDDNMRVIGTRLAIYNVQKANEGNYICVATNSEGESRSKMMLRVVKQDLPAITISPQPFLRVKAGQTASFVCLATNQPDVTVSWIRANQQALTENTYLSNGGSKLNFRDISKAEEGNYVCVATNSAGRRTSRVRLSVMEPPVITVSPGYSIETREGEEARMTCGANGDPVPSVVWLKSNEAGELTMLTNYRQRSITYTIEDVDQNDSGVYYCRAINHAGTSQKQVTVTVTESETSYVTPEVRVEPSVSKVFAGNSQQLNCFSSGNPPPRVTWFKRDGELPLGSEQTGGVLRLRDLTVDDSGTYECTASNAVGQARGFVDLQVIGPPVVRAAPNDVTKEEGESVAFDCVIVANGDEFDIQPRWERTDGGLIDLSKAIFENGRLIMNNLELSDAGQYTCSATNDAGRGAATVTLKVTESEEEPEVSRSTIVSRSGDALRLSCQVDDDLSVTDVQWRKQNGPIESGAPSGSNYVIDSARIADSGVYICDAQYDTGLSTRTFVTVYVHAFVPYFTQTPTSFVAVPIPNNQFYSTFNVSISFRPNAQDGLLFYTYGLNQDFASLSLRNGYVEFRYELGSGTATIRSWSPVQLRQWNTVVVSRSVLKGELYLNDDRVKKGRSPGEFRALDVSSDLFIGGLPSSVSLPSALEYLGRDVGFYGCISQMDIGNGLIDFGSVRETSEMVGIVRCKTCGTHDEDNPCENKGLCLETHSTKTGFTCDCRPGFSGEMCETSSSSSRTRRLFERPARATLPKVVGNTNSSFQTMQFHSIGVCSAFKHFYYPYELHNLYNYHKKQFSNSYAHGEYNLEFHRYRTDIDMKIRFDTFENGLIIFIGLPIPDSPYFSVSIRNNHLEFQFKNTAVTHVIRAPVDSLEAGKWHSVVAMRRRGRCELIVNGKSVARKSFSDSGRLFLEASILLGAPIEQGIATLAHIQNGFSGCLKELKIDDKMVEFEAFRKSNFRACRTDATAALEEQREPQYAAAFRRSSYVSFPKKIFRHKTNTEEIRLRFKTTQPNGVILLQTQAIAGELSRHTNTLPESENTNFVLVEIKNSLLVFSFRIFGDNGVASSQTTVSDGSWHNVIITRHDSLALMWLDDVPFPIVAQTSDFVPVLPDLKGRVNLGGVPQGLLSGLDFPNFDGCIADVGLTSLSKKVSIYEPLDESNTVKLDLGDPRLAKSHKIYQCFDT